MIIKIDLEEIANELEQYGTVDELLEINSFTNELVEVLENKYGLERLLVHIMWLREQRG